MGPKFQMDCKYKYSTFIHIPIFSLTYLGPSISLVVPLNIEPFEKNNSIWSRVPLQPLRHCWQLIKVCLNCATRLPRSHCVVFTRLCNLYVNGRARNLKIGDFLPLFSFSKFCLITVSIVVLRK